MDLNNATEDQKMAAVVGSEALYFEALGDETGAVAFLAQLDSGALAELANACGAIEQLAEKILRAKK